MSRLTPSQLRAARKVAPLVALPTLFLLLAFGVPRLVLAWHARSEFMSGCTMGHLDDDRLIACNKAFDRYNAVVANDWKPVGDQE